MGCFREGVGVGRRGWILGDATFCKIESRQKLLSWKGENMADVRELGASQGGASDVGRQADGAVKMMMAEAAIPIMVERIVDGFDPIRVTLFGSRARGDYTRYSDVDLLVVLDGPIEPMDRRQTRVAIRRALGDLVVAKDIVVTTPDEIERRGNFAGSALYYALREGVTLYERS